VGAEYSGHYYFKDFFGCDSGIFTALKVLGAVSRLPYRLADFMGLVEAPAQVTFAVPAADGEKTIARILQNYRKRARKVSKTDGITVDGGDWWFTVRPSHTEPLLRIFAGARNGELLDEIARELRALTEK
jgi:phosphomannomutase